MAYCVGMPPCQPALPVPSESLARLIGKSSAFAWFLFIIEARSAVSGRGKRARITAWPFCGTTGKHELVSQHCSREAIAVPRIPAGVLGRNANVGYHDGQPAKSLPRIALSRQRRLPLPVLDIRFPRREAGKRIDPIPPKKSAAGI